MRLTNQLRQSIVRAVVADIETVDYYAQEEEIMLKAAIRGMPPLIRKARDEGLHAHLVDGYEHGSLRGGDYLNRRKMYTFRGHEGALRLTPKEKAAIDALQPKLEAQIKRVKAAETELANVLAGFTTVKQARAALPELARYLPKETQNIKQLPATTDVMPKLLAAGLKVRGGKQ